MRTPGATGRRGHFLTKTELHYRNQGANGSNETSKEKQRKTAQKISLSRKEFKRV